MPEEKPKQLREEIEALETILREKRQELEAKGESKEEKELLREAVKEHVERVTELRSVTDLSSVVTPSDQPQPPAKPQDDPLAGLDHRERIEELAAIAFSKGIVEAVNIARRANNPHLLDEFHDALVDRLYDYLVQEGIIKS